MYRLGHTGIALLVLAPLSYGLLEAHKPLFALIIGLGVLAVEPLPDLDFKVPFLSHRGVSHSLLAAVSIGGIIALCGWVGGVQVVTGFASILGATSEVVTTVATWLESLAPPETTGSVVAGTVGLLTEVVASLDWIVSQLQGLDRQTIAGVGFAVGAGGIIVHLLGDVITVSGIRPFLPFSDWNLSVSSLRAKSTLGNTGFFAVGVLAVAVVLLTAGAGIGFAVIPADLSPVGVAAGQSANQTQNTSSASIVFRNQTTNGTSVTIRSVTLSEGGYIAIHDSSYLTEGAPQNLTVIAVSRYLPPGQYENLTIPVRRSPPGGLLNKSRLNHTQRLVAVPYKETTGNHRYQFVLSFGEKDTPYHNRTSPITDTARVAVRGTYGAPGYEPPTASVVFRNQTLRNNTLVVAKVRLPRGGFLVAYNESLQRTGDAVTSAVGLSEYLPPGTHRNVTIAVLPAALNETQVVTVRPALDTNNNQRYDFVRTNGFQDTAYRDPTGTGAVSARALVRVPQSEPPTSTLTPTPTLTSTVPSTTTPPTATGGEQSRGLFGFDLTTIVGIFVVVVVGIGLIIREVR